MYEIIESCKNHERQASTELVTSDMPASRIITILVLAYFCQQHPAYSASMTGVSSADQEAIRDLLIHAWSRILHEGVPNLRDSVADGADDMVVIEVDSSSCDELTPLAASSSQVSTSASSSQRSERDAALVAETLSNIGFFSKLRYLDDVPSSFQSGFNPS